MAIESTFEKRCLEIQAPTELSFISASISIILILTNIPGNILIILALVFDPNKNLRTPFNWLVVNLATADLIVGIITQPISAYFHIKEGLRYPTDPKELALVHMAYLIPCTASVLSLTSLAVERYLAVKKPNTYRTKVTNKRIIVTIVIIWLISFSLPNIYFHVGFTTYAFIFANSAVVLAVFIMSLTYILLRLKVSNVQRDKTSSGTVPSTSADGNNDQKLPEQVLSVTTKTKNDLNVTEQKKQFSDLAVFSTSVETDNDSQSKRQTQIKTANMTRNIPNAIATRRQLLEAKVTEMFLIVLFALLCCYGPSTIMMYLVNFCESCSCVTLHWFRDIHILFALMNSSINFLCYALRSIRFRNAFLRLLRIGRVSGQEICSSNISNLNIRIR